MKSDRIEIRCKVCDTPWEAPVIGCPKCKPTPSRAEEKDKLTQALEEHANSMGLARSYPWDKRTESFTAGYQAGLRDGEAKLEATRRVAIACGKQAADEIYALKAELSAAKSELNDWEGTCSRQYSEITRLREALEKIIALPKIPTRGGGYYTHESVPIAREALLPPGTKGEK